MATNDVPQLRQKAGALLEPLPDDSVELPLYIVAEAVYVLTQNNAYDYTRDLTATLLKGIIAFMQFSCSRDTANRALDLFAATKLDFVDCLLLARNQLHHQTVLTFDKALLSKLA